MRCVQNRGFHAELFPDTYDVKAAQSGEEYFGGANKDPLLANVETKFLAAGSYIASPSSASASMSSASHNSSIQSWRFTRPE